MNYILQFEQIMFLFLNNLGTEKYDQFWLFLSNEYYWIPTYLFITIIIYYKFGIKNLLFLLLFLGIALYLSDSFSMFCKTTTERFRPCKNHLLDGKFRLVIDKCVGTYSFFSAHASNHTLMAFVFYYIFRMYPLRFLFILWALLISYSRIYLGVHFPLDIIFGILIGFILSQFVIYILKKMKLFETINFNRDY